MEIIQYSNGPEGTKNSSNQNGNSAGVQTPDNDSYQQSLYVAAISQYLGFKGLVGPATHTCDGNTYAFDFYHPKTQKFFKVFKSFDAEVYRLYSEHPNSPYLIFDLPETLCYPRLCECDRCESLVVDGEIDRLIHGNPFVRIYQDGRMWECVMRWNLGLVWRNMLPTALADLMGDNNRWDNLDEDEVDCDCDDSQN